MAETKTVDRDASDVPATLKAQRPRLADFGDVLHGEDLAALLGVSVDTVRRWHGEGEIPGRAAGRKLFFLKTVVIEWLEGEEVRGGSQGLRRDDAPPRGRRHREQSRPN